MAFQNSPEVIQSALRQEIRNIVDERIRELGLIKRTCPKTFKGANKEDTPCGQPEGHAGGCSNGTRGR